MAMKIDREVLAGRIRELEGLSMEERSALLELLNTKKYGLVWENHEEAVEEHLREYLPVLKEDTSKALTDGGENAPNHILIEGDNLEALTALTYTHEGRVDVIYIDPPYNTGNKDFVYDDSFVDSEDGYRHSKWLSFMEKRLKIAKKLLSDKGVIFISIDDNEQANLKLLCDEVFGEQTFVTNLHVEMSATQGMKVKAAKQGNIVKNAEYIQVYKKNSEKAVWHRPLMDPVKYDNHYNLLLVEHDGYYTEIPLIEAIAHQEEILQELMLLNLLDKKKTLSAKNISLAYEKSLKFREWVNSNSELICRAHDSIEIPEIEEKHLVENLIYKYVSDNRQYLIVKNNKGEIYQRIRLSEKLDVADDFYGSYGPTRIRGDWWPGYYLDMGNVSKEGGVEYKNGKKPVRLIEQIINHASDHQSIVLDFFAGSGTTMHAVMLANQKGGGRRQCICVQGLEKNVNICENITYPRIRNIINDFRNNNLRYYKVDFVPRDNSLTGKRKLMEASTELICIKHDIYNEVFTFGSLKLRPHIARYFEDKGLKVMIIYKEESIEYFVKEIAQMPEDTQIMVYVFSTNNYALDADFEEVADKVTLCALPAAIYNAYLKVLPKKKVAVEAANGKVEELSLFNEEEDEQ